MLCVPGGLALPRYTAVALFQVVYAFPVPILLGLLGVCLGITAGLSVGFYWVLVAVSN